MFKNIIMYRIGADWAPTQSQVEEGLAALRFVACGAHEEKSVGWVEPRGEAHGPLVEVVNAQLMLKLKLETKVVPASVVARKAKERAAQIEASTGRKPGKKETREIKDDVRLSLMPLAFSKEATVWVWIDPQARLLVMDAGSQAKADEVVTLLVKSLDGLNLQLINTQVSPMAAMADWLLTQEAPAGFTVDRDCELKAADESKAVVRYARHALDTDEVQAHVKAGKLPTRLALTWSDRVSLVLTEGLQLKKIEFLDVVFDNLSHQDEGFDADVTLTTAELQRLLPDLLLALGGELVA